MDPCADDKTYFSTSSDKRPNFSTKVLVRRSAAIPSSSLPVVTKRQTKKLLIKNFREKPTFSEKYGKETWQRLKEAVEAILSSRPINTPLEELYQAVENLCSLNLASQLYDNLKEVIKTHLMEVAQPVFQSVQHKFELLKEMERCWDGYSQRIVMIRSVFLYLDRRNILQTPPVPSIWDMNLKLFKEVILGTQLVQTQTVDGIMMLIEAERDGNLEDMELLTSLLKMLSEIKIYQDIFDKKYLQASDAFFTLKPEYLRNKE